MNIKRLIGIAAVSVALIAGATYAYSEETPPACHYGNFSALAPGLIEAGAKVTPLPDSLVKSLIDQKGPPPGAEGQPFTIARIDQDDYSALVVLVGDCIQDKVGPVPTQVLDNFLGVANAGG